MVIIIHCGFSLKLVVTLVSAILSAAISALIEKALGHDGNSDPREQERKNSGIGFFDVRDPKRPRVGLISATS
ncbi:MAG: hypothetical protein WAN05_06405 [Roseiarcus sp.]